MPVKRVVAPTLLVALFAILLIRLPLAIASRVGDYEFFDPIIDIRHLIAERYVEAPDEEAMQEAMISAMIETLGDPHTIYVPPALTESFEKDLHGKYVGIGAEVSVEDGYLKIITPMDGSPALEAGVMAGDLVLEVEGESTYQKPISQSIDKLLGEPNTPVTIKVRHLDGVEEQLTVVRRQIVARTVRGLRRLGERWTYCIDEDLGLVYIRLTQFGNSTIQEMQEVLAAIAPEQLNGLLLDLRDNPGGELRTAVEMVDLFLDDGPIVSVKDRDGEGPVFRASPDGAMLDFDMIVLVNGASASASEIVAGALQDNSRARVLGTRSHGKGSVQEVRPLPFDRGTLKITTAHYYLPSGRNIHRTPNSVLWGVDPDLGFLVPVTDEAYLEKMRARRDYEVIREEDADGADCYEPGWIRDNLKDEQLARAVDVLRTRVTDGQWPEATEEEDAGAVALHQELHRAIEHRGRLLGQLRRLEGRLQELQAVADEAGGGPLLPPDLDLLAGTITIEDRDGNHVGSYRIEGGDVALALETLEVSPLQAAETRELVPQD